ncbi:MAG: alpha/beta fold hydrolase [Bacteroidia bacterium]
MILFSRNYGETGPTLLILHGLFGQSDNWAGIARKLSDKYRIYVFDLRNHGESDHSEDFSYELMAEDVIETIEAAFLGNVHLLGHSMGGKVAMVVAQKRPDLLKSLLVADIAPKYYRPHHEEIIKGLNALNPKEIKSRPEAEEELENYIPDFGTRQFLLKNLGRADDNSFEWKFNLKVLTEKIENIGKAIDNTVSKVPALFYRGEKSRYVNDEDYESIKKIFPNAEFSEMKDAGHWLHAENPNEMMKTIEEWIAKNE